jgi:DNA-binding response OmpR family regulator
MHVLIAEDQRTMATSLKQSLEEENHSVGVAFDGRDAFDMAQSLEYDAIVISVTLPGIDGFEVTRRLRKIGNKTPILVLSSCNTVPDIVKGLDVGADDYVTKPFYFEELLARLRSVSRRSSLSRPALFQVADLILDPTAQRVIRAGEDIPLGRTEYRLLAFLMRRAGRVASRCAILNSVWDSTDAIEENTLDVYISKLRNKVDRDHKVKLIHTVRGFGYSIQHSEAMK